MVTLLLTRSFTGSTKGLDDAGRWAVLRERVMRELAWRAVSAEAEEVSLLEVVPATDAGHVCHECGRYVSWTDHLPPLELGGPVRCFVQAPPAISIEGPHLTLLPERTPDSTARQLMPGGKPC